MRKIIYIFLIIILLLLISIPASFALGEDTEKPTIKVETLRLNRKVVMNGDTINVSIEATDNYNVQFVQITYKMPVSGDLKYIKLYRIGNTEKYEANVQIDDSYEQGIWRIYHIIALDNAMNVTTIHNSNFINYISPNYDLSEGDFDVIGEDTEKPTIKAETLKLSRKAAMNGDTINVSIEATDNYNIQHVQVTYKMPTSDEFKHIKLYRIDNTEKYEANIQIDDSYEQGKWKIYYIVAVDNALNITTIHNSNFTSYISPNYDFCEGDFTVITDSDFYPISGIKVFKENTYISNTTINDDIYIGPKAVVVFNNVTVNGDIYVLGGAKLKNVSAKKLFAKNFQWSFNEGNETYYNGTVYYYQNELKINSIITSDYCIEDILYKIADNEFEVENDILKIKGATVDIADFYINGKRVYLLDDGRFYSDDINVGSGEDIKLQWRTIFGNTITKKIKILKNISLENECVMQIENEKNFQINLEPSGALMPDNIVWKSEKEDIAIVDDEGKVNALKVGETLITAKTKGGKIATCKLKVTEYKLGDVNQDERINAQDATLILKYLAKKVDLTDEQLALADTDRDGRVKASDAVRILKYVAKKISEI